jgi:serine/threonine-protein kinase
VTDSPPQVDPHAELIRSLIGTTVGGRYVVERLLGRGGMGLVLEARHRELEQKVAIKVILPEFSANSVVAARFMREAKVAARVSGRHLVRVFDVGKLDSGMPYLAMELLSGNDLDAEVSRRGALPIEEAIDYMVQAALGLAELHTQGIVHRDLKPSNLFISTADGERTIKILDFGISKEAPGQVGALTGTDTAIGTPSYMSPEQIKTPKEVDPRSDIWSLGVILAELLTTKLPFPSESASVGELFGIILFRDPVPPRQRRPDLPLALSDVVMRCLSKNPDQRYRDVAEFAEALRPFASDASRHRIDAVRRAVGPVTMQSRSGPAASAVSSSFAQDTAQDSLPTVVDPARDPTQLSAGSEAANAPPLALAAISRPAVFVQAASGKSLATSTRNISFEVPLQKSPRALLIFVAGIVVFAVGAFAFARVRFNADGSAPASSSTLTGAASSSAAAAPQVEPLPSLAPNSSASPPKVEPQTTAIVGSARASTLAPNVASANPKPRARPKSTPKPGADDLILDRR